MPVMSFRDYVLTHSPEDSPAGDFIMDSKHPSAKFPDVKSWRELREWLEGQSAASAVIDAAQTVWKRYLRAKDVIPVRLGTGLTVAQLIALLKKENPNAHVVKFNPTGKAAVSRVLSFSKVSIQNGGKTVPAILLED